MAKEKKTADTLQEAYLQRLPLQFFTSQSIVTSELIERQSPSLSCWPFIILAIVMLCWCSHTAWGQLTLTSFPLRGEADSSALHLINKDGYMRRKQMYVENKTLFLLRSQKLVTDSIFTENDWEEQPHCPLPQKLLKCWKNSVVLSLRLLPVLQYSNLAVF